MSNIPPIEDGYIDSVIKSSGTLKPNLNKTQGVELRALVKLLRDRLEGEIADHYVSNQAALFEKADVDQVVLKTTKVNGKPLYGDITLDKNDIGLGNVNNTSDLDKPLSSFAQAALALKADMADVNDKFSLKVDKVSGKQLSTEDFSSAEKDKLAGIQNEATANESNAYLLGREHHTGSQAIETVVGLRAELDDKLNRSEKGQANGTATLDVNGKIPLGQLSEAILGSVNYQGNYDAAANNPSLPAAVGNKGKYYVVAVAGNQQGLKLNIGDWIISNGDIWQRVDNNNKVTSVNGKQGAIVLSKTDIGLNNADNTSDYNKPISAAQQIALDSKVNSNGSNAAGVWGINISGNANTVSILNSSQIFTAINGSNIGSNTLNVNIFGRSAYSDRIGNGSADMAFHWQGQSGQPNWLWGGNEAGDMYVYNPANFNVQNAIQWNGVSINWADDSGTNLNDIIGIDVNTGAASRYNASYIKNWLNLNNTFQPLENQRLSNTNAVQFQSVFLNEYVSTPKIDLRGVTNPSFIQGNGEFIDIRPSSDVRILNIINNDTPSVVIHARDGQVDMALLVSNNIQNAGRTSTGTLTLTATSQDVADIDKVLVGKLGTGDAYWASNNYFRNNVLGLGSAAYLNASGGDDAIQFGHVVKYNSSGFIRTAAKNYPQSGGLTALYGGKGEDDFVWAFNHDAVKTFLNYNGSQIYSDVSNVNADIQVSKYLRWKQHGSGHVIFDASAGTSPSGASIDRNNPQVQVDGGVNPVLMGWNGVNTYGVRVDNARLADHSLNTDKWAGLSRTAGIVNGSEIGYLHILNGSGDNSGLADRNTIKSWLGFNTDNQWSIGAGDIDLNALSDFIVQESYGSSTNVPFGQQYNLVVNFKSPSAQRGLQLASYYGSVDHFYVRSKFDTTGLWKAWKEFVTHDQLNLQLITSGGTITTQPIGVNMYDGQPASVISLAIGDNDTGFQRGGDGVTGYYSNSNLLYNLNDPASIRNFLNLNTNQDPIFRNLTANEAHLSKIWSFYGEASVNNYSWTDAAFTTTSIEIVTSGNNAYTNKAPTLAFHRYGSGGPQFRLDPTGTNVLYLESANVNSSRNGAAYGGGNNNYFNKLVIDGGLQVNGNTQIGGIGGFNGFELGNNDQASYDSYNFRFRGWWGMGMADHIGNINGYYDFRSGLWDVKGGYKVNGHTIEDNKLQSTSHYGTFWLENNWDGTYWQLHSNHGSPVNVGRANTAGTADTSNYVNSPDGSRQPNDIFPQNNPNRVRFDFSNAANVGVGGNYAGVMTYSPWSGTTASTGDASYQLIFGSTGPNADGVPMLRIRKGIDTTWNGFYDIYTSADISKIKNDLGLGASAYEGTTLQQAYNRGNTIIGSLNIASSSTTDTGYNSAGLVIREGYMGGAPHAKPRLSFHWAGVVASQLMLEADGAIAVLNNPGTGYEKFRASSVGAYELRSINTRSDGGVGKIDFADIGIGYNLSAKYWTFWNGAGEHYGITNDYSGTGAQLSIIAAQTGGNIRFYSGMDVGTNRGIERMSIESNGDIYVKGYTYFHGDIKIGHNQGASRITMGDVDEQQRDIHCNSSRIGFLSANGSWGSYCNNDGGWISDNYVGGVRIFAGFDSGITGSVNASNWFRSNGNSGWINETYQGGIYMEDTTWVKVYNGKAFMVNNEVNANRMVVNTDSFKSASFRGMAGDYDQNGTTDKIIWTIGDNWATIQNMYGVGYQYATKYGNAHSIVFRVSGNVTSAINLENGNGYFDGKLSAGTGSNGGFGNATFVQGHNNVWRFHSSPEYGIAYYQNWVTAGNSDATGFHFGDRNNPVFYVRADGEVHMGNGKGSSSLVMHDVDDSTRVLHTNSNRIGFLNTGGGWGSYCENDGGWRTDAEFRVANTKVSGSGINITAGNGNGIGFWESGSAGAYSIWMGDTNTYGGNLSGDGSNDYNMYFRMTSANRGFVFRTGSGQDTLHITNNKVTVNGFINASGGFYDTSDKRLKTETNDVFDARNIKAYTYFKNEQLETGYYAQDVEPLMPHAIKQDNNGFLSLSYTQVLVAKVANLEDDVKRLQEEINFLKQGI